MIDDDAHGGEAPQREHPYPISAKDMLHGTALFVRDMLAHDRAALYDTYGISPYQAEQSLRYVELAELLVWGIDEMLEAVAAVPNQASSEDALRRRIAMAMKAVAAADLLHPGDAVLLLEHAGLMLSHELREAVVFMSAGSASPANEFSDEDENRLRRLLGKPAVPQADAIEKRESDCAAPTPSRNEWGEQELKKLQVAYSQPGATQESLAKQYNVSRAFIGRMLKKAKEVLRPNPMMSIRRNLQK